MADLHNTTQAPRAKRDFMRAKRAPTLPRLVLDVSREIIFLTLKSAKFAFLLAASATKAAFASLRCRPIARMMREAAEGSSKTQGLRIVRHCGVTCAPLEPMKG